MSRFLISISQLLLFCSVSFSQPITDSLKAYFPFNGNANDVSGNGFNGTVTGAILTSDRFGNPNAAYEYDGVNDRIEFLTTCWDYPDRTILIWFNAYSANTNPGTVFASDHNTLVNGRSTIVVKDDAGTKVVSLQHGQGSITERKEPITLNEWNMVAISIDKDSIRYYFNCQKVLTQQLNINTSVSSGNNYASIGMNRLNNKFFDGKLDDLHVYNRALSDSEICVLAYKCLDTSLNKAPIVSDTCITLEFEGDTTICFPEIDPDLPDDQLFFSSCFGPYNGSGSINVNGCINYQANSGFSGKDSICVIVCDSSGLCDTALLKFTILPDPSFNSPPIINNYVSCISNDSTLNYCFPQVDPDLPGDFLTFSSCTNPLNGNAVVNANGCITYTPDLGFAGTDSFCVVVCDQGIPAPVMCDTATVIVKVIPASIDTNWPPVILPAYACISYDSSASYCFPQLDPDLPQDDLAFSICDGPDNGSSGISSSGCINYTPDPNFSGLDTICVVVCDQGNPAPVLCDTSFYVVKVIPPDNSDSIELPCELYIPNAFSPNNDGKNDNYWLRSGQLDRMSLNFFRIYNRWGEMIFETQDFNQPWDGSFKGSMQSPDVFVYHVDYLDCDGVNTVLKGNVTIIR